MSGESVITTCTLCGQALAVRFQEVLDPQTREVFQILACPSCGHARTWPVPAVLDAYYGDWYYGGRHGWTARYCARRRLRLVGKISGPGAGRRLLDVGCGEGTFLLDARNHGWKVQGTELNPGVARKAGLNVCRSLDEAAAHAPFDFITAWHVLEHFPDPLAALQTVGKMLVPGGALLLAVPNAEGAAARLWGPNWWGLDVPRHLHHFSKRSLELHLAKTGFSIERFWYGEFEYDLLGWSQSALNCLLSDPNLFFELLTGQGAASSPGKRAVHFLLGVLLSGLALVPTWWGMFAGRAGTLIVAARLPDHTSPDVPRT